MNKTAINYKDIFYPPGGILMWIIIFLELITFGMALVAFVYYGAEEAEVFHQSKLLLNPTIGAINTIFLLTSGLFVANAIHFYKEGNTKKTTLFFKLAMLGGLLFLLLKSFEYYTKITHGITLDTNTFFSFYWMLTGFHIIHVLIGLVLLFITERNISKNKAALEDVEATAAFWHMCDIIWLLLFPVIYLIF
ncbi:cytochrome c oxidase subunit 3 [uncultured Flavobacterium sp.]|uniref:cytochrome c oxidase subunit 3 n=1 Tax=uncultured Flavobacterium sp. TaxID=165435 RepID=UPI0030EBD5E4|tara:strand:+ start:211738 stop:212313 length:576 start_codon:yes stop_codon:yes gene_type:complete